MSQVGSGAHLYSISHSQKGGSPGTEMLPRDTFLWKGRETRSHRTGEKAFKGLLSKTDTILLKLNRKKI